MEKIIKSSMKIMLCLATSLFVSSCAINNSSNDQEYKEYGYTFNALGYAPISLQNGKSEDERILNAIKASKLEAYKELAEQIFGVMLHSKSNMKNAKLANDQIEITVSGLIKGAKVLKSYPKDNMYITEIELNMKALPHTNVPEFQNKNKTKIKPKSDIIKVDNSIVKKQTYY